MTLSVDDQVTLVEAGVILIGIAITWVVYRRPRLPQHLPETTSRKSGGPSPRESSVDGSAAE